MVRILFESNVRHCLRSGMYEGRTKIGRRPKTSEPGPHKTGPAMYPARNKLVSRFATSSDTPNFKIINSVEEVGADDANVLSKNGQLRSSDTKTVPIRTH